MEADGSKHHLTPFVASDKTRVGWGSAEEEIVNDSRREGKKARKTGRKEHEGLEPGDKWERRSFLKAQVALLKCSRCRPRRDMTESHFGSNLESNQANLLPKWLVSHRRNAGLKPAEWFVMLTGTKLKRQREQPSLAVTKQQITATSDPS